MRATYHLDWRDWVSNLCDAIDHALDDIDQSSARGEAAFPIEYAFDCSHATAREVVDPRTDDLESTVVYAVEAALTLQEILDNGPDDATSKAQERHKIASAIPALLRYARALLDEYASAMDRHEEQAR
ncbi:hypothetical protein FYJ43_04485 [Cutibacterium sp. WCA-380-WT-3A]|uniref:Uncharacterized protein n=1 Tax=Cutibacterium porci TaxID=2605781 RepID=A0A7K0J5V1_9ACTN|nr:hypothetical protein [Cutibacterium porci]MSS45315.1 hypothetical protein [Cutibacterium porci]